MKPNPRVSTAAFLLVVDASRLDHGFNHPGLAAQISRHAIMTNRRPVQNADLVAGVEERFLAEGVYDALSEFVRFAGFVLHRPPLYGVRWRLLHAATRCRRPIREVL